MPTLSTMPTQRYIMTTLDPPAEKNGSVTPMTGSTCKFMPMFITHCKNSAAKMPTQILQPSASGHCRPVRSVRRQSANSSNSTAAAPRKPKTFARYAKIKSFQALGTKMCSPESSPCPVSPPVPMAMAPLFCW